MVSLLLIVMGVLMTTKSAHSGIAVGTPVAARTEDALLSTLITLAANLCFSFRGAYQTLLNRPGINDDVRVRSPIADAQLFLQMSHFGFFLSLALVIVFDVLWPSFTTSR